jgi:hypothetical protein
VVDNVIGDSGDALGATFATDDIAGVHYPRTKLVHGADGTNDGDVSTANPLPVELTDSNQTVVADVGAIKTAVELLDNAISGTEMQVDVVAALPAGTNAIGKLAANSGVDIGDVDVTSIAPGVGATNLGKAEDSVHTSGDVGVMALGVRNDDLVPLAADGDYTPLQTDVDGALWIHQKDADIDSNNSTTTPLALDAVFTGTATDILGYSSVSVIIHASHSSATDGMTFQYSPDGTNWDKVFTFTFTGGNGGRVFQLPIHAQYFRIVYTNSGTNQTHFRCQTLLLHVTPQQTTHRLSDSVNPDRSVAVTKSAIVAQAAGSGDFIPVQSTTGGNLKVSIEEADTSATGLAKAIDNAVGATDTGIALLAKHKSDVEHLTTAEGDYDVLTMSDLGALQVAPEQHHILDGMNATTGWTALGNDTLNLATTTKHAIGTNALTFDKVDGAANTVFAGIQKTLSSFDLGNVSPHDIIQTVCYVPDITNVSYIFVRIGTDSSNYNEWRVQDTDLTAATFETLALNAGDVNHAGITGNGWDTSAITYVAVGVAFDAETDTLAGIIFDEVSFHTNQHTSASLNSEVSSSVSSANINVQKVGGSVVDKGAGNASNGSQRIVIATDDINLAAIKTSVEIIDDAVAAEGAALGSGVLLQGDDGTDRKNINVDATTGDVQVDVTNTVTVDLGANNDVTATGSVAHDAADSGNPVKTGAKAKNFDGTAPGTAVAEDDRVDHIADVYGRPFVETAHPNHWDVSVDYAAAQANATVKAAPGAGLKLYITDILLSNGATAGNVTLLDGSGGTVKWECYPAVNGGAAPTLRTPIALTANTLLAITSTTVTTHSLTICGYTAP